jgi:EAL domain-containing protein (putative c-di-GMP-specific phosphodiesterase class I)
MSLTESMGRMRDSRALLESLIEEPSRLGPDWQPVRSLADNEVVGYKATGAAHAELGDTLALLAEAQGLGLVERLDWAFRAWAFQVALEAGLKAEVWLTPEPETYGTACPPRLIGSFGRGRRELKVVAEVPADAFDKAASLTGAMTEYRGWGWRVAVRDVADEADAVERLDLLRPDIVMLDLALPGRSAVAPGEGVRRVLDWTSSNGAVLMALGIDTAERRTEAQGLGVTLGRGRLLGDPGRLPA